MGHVGELGAQGQLQRRKRAPARASREFLVSGLKQMVPALERIAVEGTALGVDAGVLDHLRPGIVAQAKQLAALS